MAVDKPIISSDVALQNNYNKEVFREIEAILSKIESISRMNLLGDASMSSRTNRDISFSASNIGNFIHQLALSASSRIDSSTSPPTSASVQKEQNIPMSGNSPPTIPSSLNQTAANPSVPSFSAASLGFVSPSTQNAPNAAQSFQSSSGSVSLPGSSSSGAAASNSLSTPPVSGFSAAGPNASRASVSTAVHSSAEKLPSAQNLPASDAPARAESLSPIANREASPTRVLSGGVAASPSLGSQVPGGKTGVVFSNPATSALPSGSFSSSQATSNASTPLTASPAQPSGFSTPLAAPKDFAPVVFSASAAQPNASGLPPFSSGISMIPQQQALGVSIAQQTVAGAPPAYAFSSPSVLGVMGTQGSFESPASFSPAIISNAPNAPAPAGTQQSASSPAAFLFSGSPATAAAAQPGASVSAGSATLQAPNTANSAPPSTPSALAGTPASQPPARRADAAPQVLPTVSAPNPSSNRPDSAPVHRSRDEEGVMREDEEDGEEKEGEEETEEDESFNLSSRSKKSR